MRSSTLLAFAVAAVAQSAIAGPLGGRQFFGAKQISNPVVNAVSESASSTTITSATTFSSSIESSSSESETDSTTESSSTESSESSSATDSSTTESESSTESSSESSTTESESSTATESSSSTETSSESESSSTESSTETSTDSSASETLTGSKTESVSSTSSSVAIATATATPKKVPSVTEVLQLALTLEHLESAFYDEGLANFTIEDFNKAGLPTWAYGRFEQIAEHESIHTEFLTNVLGKDAVAACNYSFPVSTPWEFIALSEMLESVGEAAYIGGSAYLADNIEALTAGAAIIPIEARHASWIQSVLYSSDPWNTAFDTPISGNLAYTLASTFITKCPSSNPSLPFQTYPALNVTGLTQPAELTNGSTYAPTIGQNVSFSFDNSTVGGDKQYVAFISGLNTTFAPIDSNQTATIPINLQGLVFAVITTDNTILSDETIIAGPATLQFTLGSNATALY